MFIHYVSCHSILEYDEVKLLTELGYDVFANGAYRDPKGAYTLPRPGIPNAKFHEDLFNLTAYVPQTRLTEELIEPFDTFIFMHSPEPLLQNWANIKHKRVIFRSIGQSTPGLEAQLQPLVAEGLEIIRYSEMERNYENFAGENTLIRFYKDPEEFKGWTGEKNRVINFSQALKGRRVHCHHDEIVAAMDGLEAMVYGNGNNDLGALNGGELPYEMMKETMRRNRAYLYGGTWPACYTLSLIEAMMTGIPVVAIGQTLAEPDNLPKLRFYDIPNIIEDGVSGYVCNTVPELKERLRSLMTDWELAKRIGSAGRQRAIQLFGKEAIARQWREYLGS